MAMLLIISVFAIVLICLGLRIVQQYEKGVVFRFGKIVSIREPGLNFIIPFIDWLTLVDMRIVTLPIPPQKIITKDNVSVDISAVAYFKIVNAVKSIIAIQDVYAAIDQIAQFMSTVSDIHHFIAKEQTTLPVLSPHNDPVTPK